MEETKEINIEEMTIEEIRRHVVNGRVKSAEQIASELLLEIKKNILKGENYIVLKLDKLPRHTDKVAEILKKEGLKVHYDGKGYWGDAYFTVYLPDHLRWLGHSEA